MNNKHVLDTRILCTAVFLLYLSGPEINQVSNQDTVFVVGQFCFIISTEWCLSGVWPIEIYSNQMLEFKFSRNLRFPEFFNQCHCQVRSDILNLVRYNDPHLSLLVELLSMLKYIFIDKNGQASQLSYGKTQRLYFTQHWLEGWNWLTVIIVVVCMWGVIEIQKVWIIWKWNG